MYMVKLTKWSCYFALLLHMMIYYVNIHLRAMMHSIATCKIEKRAQNLNISTAVLLLVHNTLNLWDTV